MANYPKCTYNTTIVTEEGSIDIYDVEDSPEGQQNVCQILADASPKNSAGRPILGSPWCLSTFNYNTATKVATPTDSARRFWGSVYTAIPK
jgi:hypothetical protein